MDLKDWAKGRVVGLDAWARPWADRNRLNGLAYEFLLFGLKQAWACMFGGAMLTLLVLTHWFWPSHAALARYDFLVLAAVALQIFMLMTKLEYWHEAVVILAFHVVGTIMEVFKTAHGSWIYPEASFLRIGGVPLFSGFMYAGVGSYIARSWRLMNVRFENAPPAWGPWTLAILAYVNFFTHHYVMDIRWCLFVFSFLIWRSTSVEFTPDRQPRRMPLLLGIGLVALFIWIAENLGTSATAWVYPSQRHGWSLVPVGKVGAWYLLVILSMVLATMVHRPKEHLSGTLAPVTP